MNYIKWGGKEGNTGADKKRATIRTSYKMQNGVVYQLYGLPGKQPGDEGEILMQTQRGFEQNLPPMRLSMQQKGSLINEIANL